MRALNKVSRVWRVMAMVIAATIDMSPPVQCLIDASHVHIINFWACST